MFPTIYKLLLQSIIIGYLISNALAVIPHECVHNVTQHHICCPQSKINNQICGGNGRGFCGELNFYRDKVPPEYQFDDRVHWPTKFFTHICICNDNFFGVACDECWFGQEGPNCERKAPLRVRKNIMNLTPYEKRVFVDVMARSYHEPSNYYIIIEQENWRSDPINAPIFFPANIQYFMVSMHRFPSRSTLFNTQKTCRQFGILDFNHDGPIFPSWHRYFMLFWERQLQKIAWKYWRIKDFSLPYWNWIDLQRCDICTNDLLGDVGPIDQYGQRIHPNSPFYNWTEYCTEPTNTPTCYGCHASGKFGKLTRHWNNYIMPSSDDLDYVMGLDRFYVHNARDGKECKSFSMAIEGFCGPPHTYNGSQYMHNFIHNSFDGSMCCSGSATNDPIFLVHHVEVDRQIQAWWIDHKPHKLTDYPINDLRPGHCRECLTTGIMPPIKNSVFFTDIRNLGYTYDTYEFGKHGRVYGKGYPQYRWNGRSRHSLESPLVQEEMRKKKRLDALTSQVKVTQKNPFVVNPDY